MSESYDRFLERIIQFRIDRNLTQEELSRSIGITQSQYSKMELGKTIYPYTVLKILDGMGWDIDYLITGNEQRDVIPELIDVLNACNEEDRKEMLQVVNWSTRLGLKRSDVKKDYEITCEMGILNLQMDQNPKDTVLSQLRRIMEISQMMMAEKLGVNIKKYRMLEKEEVYPDAELLLRIYEETGCKPGVFLKYDELEAYIINNVWNYISPELQKRLIKYLRETVYLLNM